MAKRKTARKRSTTQAKGSIPSALARGLGVLWRGIAKAIGSSIRFVFKEARELDAAHQRDGFALVDDDDPAMYAKNPGMIGSTHGERNEIMPATKAMKMGILNVL